MTTRELLDDLFRRESAHLVAALVRVLGPAHLALAEDVVQAALESAVQAWRFAVPDDPKAWLLRVAKNRAIDVLRRDRRNVAETIEGVVEHAFSAEADDHNQLAMMFAICDPGLSAATHVSLILRILCGLSAAEIARAFLLDVQTIDRRLHRGRAHLRGLRSLDVPEAELAARQPSVEHALYLLFNEGYHGSDPENPLAPALCADALRLVELLASADIAPAPAHALAALACFHIARLATRLDDDGVVVPLAEQDRSRWSRAFIERGIVHLGESAVGDRVSRWHLEAGIAFEHASASAVATTDWARIVAYYDELAARAPSPIISLNRALAIAELHGLDAGRAALAPLAGDPQLTSYSFYWAARADLERRAGHSTEARALYLQAIALATSRAERGSYERRVRELAN